MHKPAQQRPNPAYLSNWVASATVLLVLCLFVNLSSAADKSDVKAKWHTPFDLYLTPQEAHAMKLEQGDNLLFIDVRTRGELKYIGVANAIDAHIPVRFLREDHAWSKKSKTYRTRLNPDFVEDVNRLRKARSASLDTPVILMCQSGSRVPEAAKLLHAAGFTRVYTQYQGFEGVKATDGDRVGQRVVNGWKNANLPWTYKLDPKKMYFNFSAPK